MMKTFTNTKIHHTYTVLKADEELKRCNFFFLTRRNSKASYTRFQKILLCTLRLHNKQISFFFHLFYMRYFAAEIFISFQIKFKISKNFFEFSIFLQYFYEYHIYVNYPIRLFRDAFCGLKQQIFHCLV